MACPNDNVEPTFLKLLETTTRFEVEANKLRLYDRDRLILLTRQPEILKEIQVFQGSPPKKCTLNYCQVNSFLAIGI
jgi:hypothetical protein